MANKIEFRVLADISQFNTHLTKVGKSISGIGRQVSIFGVATVGSLGLISRSAGDLEQGITNTLTLIQGSSQQTRIKLTNDVKEISEKYGIAKKELTTSLFDIVSATGDAGRSTIFLNEAARLAVGGNSDLTASTSGLLTLMESYGDQLRDTADGADLLFKAQEKSRATVAELAVASGRFLPIAKQLNVNVEELYGSYAQITVALGNADEAATSLQGVLNGFLKPTEELTRLTQEWGFETSQAALKELGLLGVLRKLNKVDDERIGKLFPRIEGIKGLGAALQNLEKVEGNILDLRRREGAVENALAKQRENFNFQVAQARERISNMVITIGTGFLPVLKELFGRLDPLVKKIGEWISNNTILTTKILAITAAVGLFAATAGPLLIVLGGVVTAIGFLISPIGLAITAFGLLSSAAILHFGSVREFVLNAVKNIVGFIEDLKDKFLTIQLTFQNINATPLKERLLNPIQTFKDSVSNAESVVRSLRENGTNDFEQFVENTDTALLDAEGKINSFKEKVVALKNEFNNIVSGPVNGPLTEQEAQAAGDVAGADAGADGATPGTALLDSFVPKPEEVEKRFGLLESLKAAFIGRSNSLDSSSRNSVKKSEKDKLGFIEATAEGGYLANLKSAKLNKAIGIKEALVNTYGGVARAFNDYKFPFSLVVAAITLARGLATVSQISSIGFQQGAANLPDDTVGLFNKKEIVVPTSFSEGIRRGDLALVGSGQAGAGGGPMFDFRGATFNGVTDELITQIFTRASEKIFDKTLVFYPGV